jgi:hypothetical protein
MTRRGSGLAKRFQVAVESEQVAREAALEGRDEELVEACAARDELMDDLEHFGQNIALIEVSRSDEGLVFQVGDRFLSFSYIGLAGNVGMRFSGSSEAHHRLYREEDLNNKWVWYSRQGGGEDRTVLFDSGLEELMVLALGLPRPYELGEDAAEPGQAALEPKSRTRTL